MPNLLEKRDPSLKNCLDPVREFGEKNISTYARYQCESTLPPRMMISPPPPLQEGKRRKERKKERKEKRSKGRDKSLGGRDLGSPFSRIHTARFLSRSPSPTPGRLSATWWGVATAYRNALLASPHAYAATYVQYVHAHARLPVEGDRFLCVCVRARETTRRWGGYALCRPLRSLLTRFANRSLSSFPSYSYSRSSSSSISRNFLPFPFLGRGGWTPNVREIYRLDVSWIFVEEEFFFPFSQGFFIFLRPEGEENDGGIGKVVFSVVPFRNFENNKYLWT